MMSSVCVRYSYLADGIRLGDLGSVLVGHQGLENEQQPLQLLCCLLRLFSFRLHNTQDLHHTGLYQEDNIIRHKVTKLEGLRIH